MFRKICNLLLAILFICGAGIFFYPVVVDKMADEERIEQIEQFQQSAHNEEQQEEDSLYTQMQVYNQQIYEEGQAGMSDAWNSGSDTFDFSKTGLQDRMIGYLTIDKMNVHVPLYFGADDSTLNGGAAVLAQTSMPIGGTNTNSVIAAHRGGIHGAGVFKEIEKLQVGDHITIANLWETLDYQVIKEIAIDPKEIEAIKIVEGQDLVTLVSCHPYGIDTQRYLVYCQRVTEDMTEVNIPFEGEQYVSSEREISLEKNIRTVGCVGIFGMLILYIIRSLRRHHHKN